MNKAARTEKKTYARIVRSVSRHGDNRYFNEDRLERIKLWIELFGLIGVCGAFASGLWLGFLQKDANATTRVALKTAQRANDISQQNLMAAQTPWITIVPESIGVGPFNSVAIGLALTNNSEYPTTGTILYARIKTPPYNSGSGAAAKDSMVIMPHQTMTQNVEIGEVTCDAQQAVDAIKKNHLPVFIELHYTDLFQRQFMFEETLYFIANGWAVQDQMIFVDYMKDGVPSAGVLEYEKHRDSEYR